MDQKRPKVDPGVEKAVVIICSDVESLDIEQFKQLVATIGEEDIKRVFYVNIIPKLNVSQLEKLKQLVSASSFPKVIKSDLINLIDSRLQFKSVLDKSRENNIKRDKNRSEQNSYVSDPDMMRNASEAIMTILSTELDAKSYTKFKTLMADVPVRKRAVLIADIIVPRIDDAKLEKLQKLLSSLPQVDVSLIMTRVVRQNDKSKASMLLSDKFTIEQMMQSLPDEKDNSVFHVIRSYLGEYLDPETEFTTDLPKLIVDFLYLLVCQKALDWHHHQPIWCQGLFPDQIKFLEDHLTRELNQASSNLIVEFDRIWDKLMGDPFEWFNKIATPLDTIIFPYRFLIKILWIRYLNNSYQPTEHTVLPLMKDIKDISKRLIFAALMRVLLLHNFFDYRFNHRLNGDMNAQDIIKELFDIGQNTALGKNDAQRETRRATRLPEFLYTAACWIPSLAQKKGDICWFDDDAPLAIPRALSKIPSKGFDFVRDPDERIKTILNISIKILYGFTSIHHKQIHISRWTPSENQLTRPGELNARALQNIIPEYDNLDRLTWIRDYHPNKDVSSLPMEVFSLLSLSEYQENFFPFNHELMRNGVQGSLYTLATYSLLIYGCLKTVDVRDPSLPRRDGDNNFPWPRNMRPRSDYMKKDLYPIVSKLFEQRTKPKPMFSDGQIETFITENSIEASGALYGNTSVSNPFGAPAV